MRVLVPSEANITQLASLLRFEQRGVCSLLIENTIRVFKPDNLMVLYQVDAIGLQPAERFVQLAGSGLFASSVNFGHEEDLAPVTVAQRFAHPDFTDAVVVVPAVVHEVDPAIDRAAHDSEAQLFIDVFQSQMPPAQTDGRNLLTGAAESPIDHLLVFYHWCRS